MNPMYWRPGICCALIGMLAANPAMAVDEDEAIDTGTSIELIDGRLEHSTGFIIDRTVTNFGAQFVRDFSQAWRTMTNTDAVDLTIVEKPSARWGSTIFVEHNNQAIARVFLQAGRSAAIKPVAENTARYMAGKLADNSLLGLLTRDPDLGNEELPR